MEELSFQLSVTRAMLGAFGLDQVLYVILSGITHGAGLDFNRALLWLDPGSRGELRVSLAVGPRSQSEAHRIWEAMEDAGLTLEDLLAEGAAQEEATGAMGLTRRFAGLVANTGVMVAAPAGQRVDLTALVAHVAQSTTPFWSNSLVAECTPEAGASQDALAFERLACVPLVLHGRVLGVVLADNAFNGRPVDPDRVRGLATLANLAAIAIDRAHLHGKLEEMARRDGLTGVFNRRHYDERRAEAYERARRTGRSLALLVIDLDRFKGINDRHGHEVGDRVLIGVAALLRDALRPSDLLARYGGEEFVILLDASLDGDAALARAEALRRLVAQAPLAGRPAGEVTISVGVAVGRAEGVDDGLFSRADAALYRAKSDGRNRCALAD